MSSNPVSPPGPGRGRATIMKILHDFEQQRKHSDIKGEHSRTSSEGTEKENESHTPVDRPKEEAKVQNMSCNLVPPPGPGRGRATIMKILHDFEQQRKHSDIKGEHSRTSTVGTENKNASCSPADTRKEETKVQNMSCNPVSPTGPGRGRAAILRILSGLERVQKHPGLPTPFLTPGDCSPKEKPKNLSPRVPFYTSKGRGPVVVQAAQVQRDEIKEVTVKPVLEDQDSKGKNQAQEVNNFGYLCFFMVKVVLKKLPPQEHKNAVLLLIKETMLGWFFTANPRSLSLPYVEVLLKEPVSNTDSVIDSLCPALAAIRSLTYLLVKCRIIMEENREDELITALSAMSNIIATTTEAQDWQMEILECFSFWSDILKYFMGKEQSIPPINCSDFGNVYVKAKFLQMFSVKGCKKALVILLSHEQFEDLSNVYHLELQFLKARILGKLRYLAQWPADKWQEEEKILVDVTSDLEKESPSSAVRVKIVLAEFLRLRAYRRFIESRKFGCHTAVESKIDADYRKVFEILRCLEKPLSGLSEAKAWQAEQYFHLPDQGLWDETNHDLAVGCLQLVTPDKPYVLRMYALSHEKSIQRGVREQMAEKQRYGKVNEDLDIIAAEMKTDILRFLDCAAKKGSTQALLDTAGFLCRYNMHEEMSDILNSLPDGDLHWAAYLALIKNRPNEAQRRLQPFIDGYDMYPPILVHYPFFARLLEPINLAEVIFPDRRDLSDSTFLNNRSDILEENHRLFANKKKIRKTCKKHYK